MSAVGAKLKRWNVQIAREWKTDWQDPGSYESGFFVFIPQAHRRNWVLGFI